MQINKIEKNDQYFQNIVKRPEFVIIAITLVIVAGISIKDNTFIGEFNIISMLNSMSFTAIISVMLVLLLVAGYLDMSIGAVTGLLAVLIATFSKNFGMEPIVAVLLAMGIGAFIGFINGVLIVNFKLNAFIMTLAMMYTCRGLLQVIAQGRNVGNLPEELTYPGGITLLGLPLNVYALIIIAIVGSIILQKTQFGRSLYVIGNNINIATTSGIQHEKIIKILYVVTGAICAISAYFLVITYKSAPIAAGTGWEFEVTAGCMLGGCSMYGGKGTVIGGILGILFMVVLRYALQSFRMASGYQVMITGAILILSVLIGTIRTKKITA